MIRGGQAHPGQVVDVVAVGEHVHRLARQVAAFGQDPARTHGLQAAGRLCQLSGRLDRKAREAGRLRGVGGEEVSQGKEFFLEDIDAVCREQRKAASRSQHRVQHQGGV